MKSYKMIALRTGILLTGLVMLTGTYGVKADTKTEMQYEEEFNQYIENADKDDDPQYYQYSGALEENGQKDVKTIYRGALAAGNYRHNSRFNDYLVKNGVDVSKYQGYVSWSDMKTSGVEFALVRVGYRGYTSGSLAEDQTYKANIQNALDAGVKVGAYIFSQAITEQEAVEEANFLLDRIKDYDITMPVVIDYEYASGSNGKTGRLYEAGLSVEAATAVCRKFCETIEAAGYTPMIYANKNMLKNSLNASELSSRYDIWLANYTEQTDYAGDYTFWQYSSKGQMNGLSENTVVDCNFWYVPKSRSNGLDLAKNGKWYYYVDGVINKSYNGLKQNEAGWWYVENGAVNFGYTGLVQNEVGWWYVENGAVNFGYTGLAQNEAGWWYIANGMLDWSYTGLTPYDGNWWYVVNGGLDWNYSGVVPYDGNWWYVKNGMLDWGYSGLAQNEYGWWYITNGMLDWGYTGLTLYDGNWWYVINGGLDWNYSGVVPYDGNWWYVKNGMLDWGYTGVAQNESGLWYVETGMVNFNYTGEVFCDGVVYDVYNGQAVQR